MSELFYWKRICSNPVIENNIKSSFKRSVGLEEKFCMVEDWAKR